jgi:hypothetical protein
MDLNSLLISTNGLSVDDIEKMARDLYKDLYLFPNKKHGIMQAHDNEDVYFAENRFEHAFYSTKDKPQAFSILKDKLALDRIERIKWIRELVAGKVPNSECWEIDQPSRPIARLYIAWSVNYIVWLEDRSGRGFQFSTAYPAQSPYIRKLCKGNKKIWSYKNINAP